MKTEFSHTPCDLPQAPAVVVVHYGAPEPTLRCLDSLVRLEPAAHGVVVVDHSATPGLAEQVRRVHPRVSVLVDPSNPGFGAGCNRGAHHALAQGADALWFLNNDATVQGPLLERLGALATAHPDIALWGTHQQDGLQRIGADRQKAWFAEGLTPFSSLPDVQVLGPRETLSGASIFLTRAGWERVGPWPEDYFLYWEDAAWCRRVHALGLGLALLDEAVLHPRGTTTGRRSPLTTFYGVRNMLRLHAWCRPDVPSERLNLAVRLLQRRFFQGRWSLLQPTWDGIRAAARNQGGRDPRY